MYLSKVKEMFSSFWCNKIEAKIDKIQRFSGYGSDWPLKLWLQQKKLSGALYSPLKFLHLGFALSTLVLIWFSNAISFLESWRDDYYDNVRNLVDNILFLHFFRWESISRFGIWKLVSEWGITKQFSIHNHSKMLSYLLDLWSCSKYTS